MPDYFTEHSENTHTFLSVVIPVYRNAAELKDLVERLYGSLKENIDDFVLIFVIDGSPDNSLERLQELKREYTTIRILDCPENIGQHSALLRGIEVTDSDWVAIMDADLQDPPEVLSEMVEAARNTGHSVYGYRQGCYQSYLRMLSSRIFKSLLGMAIGLPSRTGTFLILPRSVIKKMLSVRCLRPQVVVMAGFCSMEWTAVNYRRNRPPGGQSGYSFKGRMQAALRSVQCLMECRKWRSGLLK